LVVPLASGKSPAKSGVQKNLCLCFICYFFVTMRNLPYTHLQFLGTLQSHYVYLSSDLYQIMSNSDKHLSLYAWLYNNYQIYYQRGTIPTYRSIVTKWLSTLSDADRNELEKIIQGEYEHFSGIMNNKSIENKGKFTKLQHSFSSLLYHIIGWWEKSESSNKIKSAPVQPNSQTLPWVLRLPADNAIQ